jgi:hypothetical protein
MGDAEAQFICSHRPGVRGHLHILCPRKLSAGPLTEQRMISPDPVELAPFGDVAVIVTTAGSTSSATVVASHTTDRSGADSGALDVPHEEASPARTTAVRPRAASRPFKRATIGRAGTLRRFLRPVPWWRVPPAPWGG